LTLHAACVGGEAFFMSGGLGGGAVVIGGTVASTVLFPTVID